MPIKEEYDEKIKKIVDDFGLYNKSSKEKIGEFIFNDPGVILADLLVKKEKKEIKDEEIIDFLKQKLQLSTEKAKKIKKRVNQDIFSVDKNIISFEKSKEIPKKNDQYRESID